MKKECLAVLMALDKWRSYLQHREFTIVTDHKSLLHLGDQKLSTGIQHKDFLKLMGFQYHITYKKGVENLAADALSRQDQQEHLCAISVCKPKWLETIIEGYNSNPDTKQLLIELCISGSNEKGFHLLWSH
jgi:hypothetical protein